MQKTKKHLALITALIIICSSVFSLFSASAGATPQPFSLSVLGDSIASGYGLDNIEDSYSVLIAKEKKYNLSNCAVPGHTTSDLLHVVCNEEVARKGIEKANLVIISIGGNDIIHVLQNADTSTLLSIMTNGINAPVIKETAEKTKEQLLYSCMEIREINPDVPIILQSLYNPLYANSTYKALAPTAEKLVPLFEDMFSYVNNELGNIYTADVYTAFDNYYKETGSYDVIHPDGIHPSKKGHALIAQVLLQKIDELEAKGVIITTPVSYIFMGDVDGSADITIKDATLIQKYLSQLVVFGDEIVKMCADADDDENITIKDATVIQKHVAGIDTETSIGTYIPYYR